MLVLKFILRLILLIIAVLAPSYAAANGIQVSPLIIELSNSPGATGSFVVRNTATGNIPVEVTVVRRVVGSDNKVELVPADGDFVIFPPQALISGRQTQSFRFQFIGNENQNISTSYYIYATQLPVDLENDDEIKGAIARLNFLYEYGVSVNVVPDGATPELVVTNAKKTKMADGRPAVNLTIENQGNRFGRASEHELTISSESGSTVFSSKLLKAGLNNGMWLPGQSFDINFPLQEAAKGRIEATFEYVGG